MKKILLGLGILFLLQGCCYRCGNCGCHCGCDGFCIGDNHKNIPSKKS